MNLDELKIKVSIDLNDFNKQLSAITKGIDKAFGPKATKKMMQANHKIIKKESAEINKTLNQAFELDFAKFNTNLNKAMNQAKRTVQQTCREIRSEINSAFDIKGTVRITGKASVSNSSSSQRSAESAAIVQSSQYTGAMINKAVNEMIRTNNANTTRLETAIGNLANRLAKVIADNKPVPTSDRNNAAIARGATQERDIKANTIIETSFKVIDDELQSIVNRAVSAIKVPKLEAPIDAKLITGSNEIQDAVNQVVQYVQAPEILASLDLLDSGVQEQLDDIVDSINISNLIIELTAEEYNIQDEVDDIVDSVNVPEIIVNVLAEDNDIQDTVDDIADSVNVPEIVINVTAEDDDVQSIVDNVAESVDVPEVVINITAEDNNVQSIVDDVAESVNIPEIVVNVTAEDLGVQEEVDDITYSIDIPELVVQLTVEDADIQNEVNKIIRGIDVPELTANIELLDTGIQNEANKTVKSTFVPELLSELRIEAKDLQNEVNKILGNINVPVLIADISLMYSNVQDQLDKIIKNVDIPRLPISFEINQTELQSMLNSAVSDLRLPKIPLPVSVARPKTKDENKATSNSKIVKKTIESPEQTAVDVPVNVTGEEEVSSLEKKLLECGKAVKDLKKNFINIKGSKDGIEEKIESLKKLQQEALKIGAKGVVFRATFDIDDDRLHNIAKTVHDNLSNIGQAIENEVEELKSKLGKGLDDATDELSFTSDSDDMFTQMSDIVDKEIEEIKGKLKHLNMMYKSLFSRPVISKSLKFDLNVANKELAETFNNIEAVKKFLDTFAGSYGTEMDTSILEQDPEIRPSLIIDDNESFSDFGKRVEDEIDDIQDKLKDLSRQYSSLFDNEYISTTFSYDSDLANKALREVINTIGELKVSMESLNEYQGFQNKFEAPEPAGVPMVASDALNEPFKAIADDIDNAYNKTNELRKAVEELFNLFRMPIEARFSKTIGDVEQLKNEISNLLSMIEFGPGLEGFRKQIEANSEQIDDAIEKIFDSLKTPFAFSPSVFKEIATLHKAIEDISGSEPGLELKALKTLEDLDTAALEEVARLEKEIAEDEARRTLIIAELEKRISNLKEDLADARDMTSEEFEAEFNLDKAEEGFKELRQTLLEYRDSFKEINRNSNIEINVRSVRDCISLVEKLQAKVEKIQASKIVPEVEIPEPEEVEMPEPIDEDLLKAAQELLNLEQSIAEDEARRVLIVAEIEKRYKNLKEELIDIRDMTAEEFEAEFDLDESKENLARIRQDLLQTRDTFKEINQNSNIEIDLKPIRDCLSLVEKLKTKIDKIQSSKIVPEEVEMPQPEEVDLPKPEAIQMPEPIDEDLLKTAQTMLRLEEEIAEGEAKRSLIIAELERRYKSLKEELIDIRSMSDEDFKADFDINEGDLNETREELSGIKQELIIVRELFKDIKNNTDIKVDLKTVRDCISLVEKIQAKIDKIEASKIAPTINTESLDPLRGLDFADEIELNLGIDQLKEQLQSLTSVDNLNINLDDLRRDIVLLLEEIDKVRSATDDEIIIQVVDDEVAKIVNLLKLVDELREQSKINLDINADVSDAMNALDNLADKQDDIREKFKTPYGVGSGLFSTTPGGPTGGGSGGNGGGRIVSSGNFTTAPPPKPEPDFDIEDTGMDFNAHVRAFNMAKLIDKFKDMSSKIKKIMGDVSNTIKSKLKGAVTGALGKLASAAKSMWSKITGIFRKGAKDSANATNTLGSTIKDLARQFFSLYALWNGAKMAIQSAENLIQGEQKLTTVMKNRMKATDESVRAIKDLIDAQQQLGVVGKEVQYNAAQQLSVFLQSSKALQTLIPSMNDLIAQQYGSNATLEEGAEVARKVGQAIVEGEFTELQESTGITLSETEIEKFRSLRTEEERAAMLADILADRIGNMNQELANTPYGAISQLKNNFMELLGTVGTFIINAIKPLVQWLNLVVVACTKAIKALGLFFGFSFDATSLGLTGGGSPSEGMEDTKESIDEATEAAEKFKGSLMGFDEINILSDNTNKNEPPETDGSIAVGDGELTPDTGGLDLMSDKMKKFLDEVLEPFKKAWDLLGDRWIAAWERLKEKFKEFCDSLAKFLKSVWDNGGKEFVQHLAEIALACGIAAMEIGGTILDALAKLWEHLDPEKNMHTQRLLDVLNEVSVKLRDFILGLNEHLENLLKYGGQDVLNAMGDCFMDLAAAAVNTFGVIIDAVDGLIDHLDPKFNVDTRNMLQATADMFHAVGTAAWDFSELLKSALANGGQDMINAFGTCVVNLGETAARVITTMMESFSAFFDYIDPAKNEITKNMMKAWEDAFYAIGDAALQFATLFESIMGNGGQEVLNKLGDAFNSLLGLVGDVVKEIADALNGLFEHLNPKTNEFTQGMLKAWQDAFDGISEMCEKISDVLSSVMDNGGQALLNAIGDLGMQILETFGNIVEEVADCVGQLFEHLDPDKNKVAKGAIDAFKYFVDSIRNFVEMLGDALGTFMDNGGQEFINNVGDIVALLLDLGATIGGDIISAISAFFDSWAGHVVISTCATALELISEVLEGLLRILEPLTPVISAVVAAIGTFIVAQKVVGFIEGIVGAFKLLSGAGGALALAKAGFTALWGIIAANPIAAVIAAIAAVGVALVALYNKCEGFREFADKVLEGFKGAFDKIKEHCSKLLEDIRDIFGNVIDIITGIFEGDGYKVGEAVRNLIFNILELIYDLNQSFVEIGWELIKGLVKGIWECIKTLPSLLAGFCEFVIDFFKGLFGIHSPSTVFAELGVNLIEGLIEGIESMMSAIGEIFTAISDGIVQAFEGITEKLSEVWNSIKESVSEAWTTIKDTVTDKCKETHDKVKEKYENIRDTVSDKLGEVKEKASDAWTKIKDKTSDIISKMKDDAEDKYNKLKDKLTTTMEDWRKNNEDKWNKVKEKTASLVDTVKKNAEEKYNKMKEALTTTMENWRKNSEDKWNKIKEKTTTLVENLKTTVEDKYNKFKEKLTTTLENWKQKSEEKWNAIKEKTSTLVENLRTNVENKYNTLKTNLSNKVDEIKSDMETKWNSIKDAVSTAVEKLRTTVEEKYNTLKTNLGNKINEIKSDAQTKWEQVKTTTVNKVSEVVTNATNKYGEIKSNFTKKMDEVKEALGPKWETLKTTAKTGAEGMVKKAGEGLSGLSKTLTDAIDKAKTAASNAWDKVKNIFSGKINMPKLPKLKVEWETFSSSWFPDIKIPKLSWNARGGIIDGITPLGFANGALQMGGEAGKEMVVPLENTSFTSKIAQAMGQAVDNAMARNMNNKMYNSTNNNNDSKDIVLKVNERELARASINSINKLQRESGRTLLDI